LTDRLNYCVVRPEFCVVWGTDFSGDAGRGFSEVLLEKARAFFASEKRAFACLGSAVSVINCEGERENVQQNPQGTIRRPCHYDTPCTVG